MAIRSNKNLVKRFFIAYAALGASLALQNSLSAQANPNAFYHCDNFDGLEMVDGKAFYHEILGRDSAPQKTYVGTYVILNERILNADYGGKGGYGKVYQVRHKSSGGIYAMKSISKAHTVEKRQVEGIKAERQILLRVTYPYIVRSVRARSARFFSYPSNTTSITHEIENYIDHIPQILRK